MLPKTTPQERLALGVTALLLAAGAAVRLQARGAPEGAGVEIASSAADTPTAGGVAALRGAVERAVAQERRPALGAGERLDPNRASAGELERLPRVGPALAARIVAHRAAHGPFRTLAELDSVPGIGPALLAGIAPHLTLPPAPPPAPRPLAAPPARAPAAVAGPLDANRASAAELDALPGVGPVLAERIVSWRAAHGPFRAVDDLEQVPGIGPKLLERLRPRLRVGP